MKRKWMKKFLFSFALLLLFPTIGVRGEETKYTYTYDFWGFDLESPDAYQAIDFITGDDLGIGDFKDPEGLYIRNDKIFVCDTGNNRIVILQRTKDGITVEKQFNEITGDVELKSLLGPKDIYVAENGDMYICDTMNQRVLHIDQNLSLVKILDRPVDETIDQTSDYLPLKIVVDRSGRILVLVKNYNKGFVDFKRTGEFSGFIGANEVKFDMVDYLWKVFSTKEQRAQMEQFVPTEYNNLTLDGDDFVYCTTSVFDEYELKYDKAKPIRKLNSMGTDILVKNGEYPPIGDLQWGYAAGVGGSSKLVDITTLDNDTYYALDRIRGRIFGYDSQGHLLYGFGGLGNKLGYLQYPTALDHMGNDLFVLDGESRGITIFQLTQYGTLINNALAEYKKGDYDLSAAYWEKVLQQNGNYDLAYIGIGRSLLRKGEYKKAMDYFELKFDDANYSKAFQLYRKQWIENHMIWIVVILLGIVVISSLVGFVKKMKREVDEA